MNDTTDRAPWCPRCGGEMVQKIGVIEQWIAFCDSCGFGDPQPLDVTKEEVVVRYARRLIRAELARQALEMRAHSHGRYGKFDSQGHWTGAWNLDEAISTVTAEYEWLGAHPLRLPGEGA